MQSESAKSLVSVIVPIYRNEKYLNKCVDSILSQTYTNLDVVLVDDGSPDRCGAMCDEYAVRDKRVQVIHQENAGVSAARNAALDAARGEYVAFIDSDDYVMPDYIEVMLRDLLDNDADMATCNCVECGKVSFNFEHIVLDFERDEKAAYKSVFKIGGSGHFKSAAWGCLYRMNIIREHDVRFPENIRLNEDVIFNLRYLPYVRRMAASPEVLYVAVPSDTSVSRIVVGSADTFSDWEKVIALYQDITKSCRCRGYKTKCNRYMWDCAWHAVVEGERFDHDVEKYRKILALNIVPFLIWKRSRGMKYCLVRWCRLCTPHLWSVLKILRGATGNQR